MKFKKILTYIFVAIFAVTISACSDSGSDSGGDDAPSPPDLTAKAQPDISFFQNNNPKQKRIESTESFGSAQIAVSSAAAFLSIGQLYSAYLSGTSQSQASFDNGKYVWTYDFAQGGVSISIKTTAEQKNNGYLWTVYVSGNDGEGNSYDEVKFMEGTVTDDGNLGDWSFFSIDSQGTSQKGLSSSWNVTSSTEKTLNLSLFDDSGSVISTIDYEEDNAEHTMTIDDTEGSSIGILWDTNSKVGYYSPNGDKQCWDGSFQDVSCSSVGL